MVQKAFCLLLQAALVPQYVLCILLSVLEVKSWSILAKLATVRTVGLLWCWCADCKGFVSPADSFLKMSVVGLAVASVSNGLGKVLALKPAEQPLATQSLNSSSLQGPSGGFPLLNLGSSHQLFQLLGFCTGEQCDGLLCLPPVDEAGSEVGVLCSQLQRSLQKRCNSTFAWVPFLSFETNWKSSWNDDFESVFQVTT